MKNIITTGFLFFLLINTVKAQLGMGNSQYKAMGNAGRSVTLPNNHINIQAAPNQLTLSIKGLNNVKADSYLAIFGMVQAGETAQETDSLMEKRISKIKSVLEAKAIEYKIYTDFISFIPQYEMDVVKKIFSRKTYNEIPNGFELKNNLHIQFKNPDDLKSIVTACARAEVYDLVRVDDQITDFEEEKRKIRAKSHELIANKLAEIEKLLGYKFNRDKGKVNDGFQVTYPIEQYKSYRAHGSASILAKKHNSVNSAKKSTTQYHMPILPKEFDFVLNADMLEPTAQIMYEIKLTVPWKEIKPTLPEVKEKIVEKNQHHLITPKGEVIKLSL